MLTNEDLLVPLSAGQPCGEDVSFDGCMDAIAAARRQDDATLAQGEWVTPLHCADWPLVAQRCAELLRTRSKDLRLAVWLAEARAHTHGWRGLGDGFQLLAGLCERYWDHVHPLPEDGEHDLRSGNLAWLMGRTPALVKDFAVCEDDAQYCLAALRQLQAAVDARLGADGPAFGGAREAVERALGDAGHAAQQCAAAATAGHGAANDDGAAAASPGLPHSRAQALAQLRLVADYFRRHEPHSPVAYLADKAAQWGELALHEWLHAVVKDPAQLAQFDELLGRKE